MFVSGTDSLSTLLEWAMTELLRHPKLISKLQSKVWGIVKNETDLITEDNMVGMHYLKAVIKDTLRLHPAAPLLMPRKDGQDVTINGYATLKPSCLWPSMHGQLEGTPSHPIGQRICPGIQFGIAVNETSLIGHGVVELHTSKISPWSYCGSMLSLKDKGYQYLTCLS